MFQQLQLNVKLKREKISELFTLQNLQTAFEYELALSNHTYLFYIIQKSNFIKNLLLKLLEGLKLFKSFDKLLVEKCT